jgi:D-alanine-D-alanine ligase
MKKNIAIVAGGDSSEYQISISSAKEITAALDKGKYNIYTVLVRGGKWITKENDKEIFVDKNDFSIKTSQGTIKFDLALIAIHGTPGEDGKLQAYFDLTGVPYTSCNSFTSALTFNKFACKSFLKEFGIPTAQSVFIRKGDSFKISAIAKKLGFPCFVKPNQGGSSVGMSKVKEAQELQAAIKDILVTLLYADELDRLDEGNRGGYYRDELSVYRAELKRRG